MSLFTVITTINPPSKTVARLGRVIGMTVVIVADQKTPENRWKHHWASYLSPEAQKKLSFNYVAYAPWNHYVRKNIGYLEAMRQGASVIYDTDDDNVPNKQWRPRQVDCAARTVDYGCWFNIYASFQKTRVWPRGFPLDKVSTSIPTARAVVKHSRLPLKSVHSPIQQGMADKNPDVDAVWRLVMPEKVTFEKRLSLALAPGTWCPFNSQSTWWWPEAYPLMYLPAFATFRMTDIWRSLVAQRCLWELGLSVAFHSPAEVVQHRNPHDLLHDFEDEVKGYLFNGRIATVLSKTKLTGNLCKDLYRCYDALVDAKFLPASELAVLSAWITDIKTVTVPC